jgi:hypothetical protein
MKALVVVGVLLAAGTAALAQIPVTDAASIANNRAAQAENIAKWVESINHLRQQIDSLNRMINIQSDVRRWAGNPVEAGTKVALESLGGPELAREFGSAKRAVVGLVDSLGSLRRTAEGTYRTISDVDIDGNEMRRDPMIYRRYAVLDAKQDISAQVAVETRDREQELQAEIADTLDALKHAETDAEVQKLTAKLTALNGQLGYVEAARRREVDAVTLQKIANDARNEAEQRSVAELEMRNAYLANQRISAYFRTLKVRQQHAPPD